MEEHTSAIGRSGADLPGRALARLGSALVRLGLALGGSGGRRSGEEPLDDLAEGDRLTRGVGVDGLPRHSSSVVPSDEMVAAAARRLIDFDLEDHDLGTVAREMLLAALATQPVADEVEE